MIAAWISVLLWSPGPLDSQALLVDTKKLPVYEPRLVHLSVDGEQSIYCTFFGAHKVIKFDGSGSVVYEINGPGKGPGELLEPTFTALMQNESVLFVYQDYLWSFFNAVDGTFLRSVNVKPGSRIAKYDEEHLIVAYLNNEMMLTLYDLHGNPVASWGKQVTSLEPGIIWSRRFAMTVAEEHSEKRVLFQEGAWPELAMYSKGVDPPGIWPLKPPKYYLKTPDEPFHMRQSGFSLRKLREYSKSFTQLATLAADDNRVAVMWRLGGEREGSIDIIDFDTREHLLSNLPTSAKALALDTNYLYTVTEEDGEIDTSLILRKFRLFPDRDTDVSIADTYPDPNSSSSNAVDIPENRLR